MAYLLQACRLIIKRSADKHKTTLLAFLIYNAPLNLISFPNSGEFQSTVCDGGCAHSLIV